MAMAPDLDAAISSIARASLRNLDVDDAGGSADHHHKSSVIRQLSESDIASKQQRLRHRCVRSFRAGVV